MTLLRRATVRPNPGRGTGVAARGCRLAPKAERESASWSGRARPPAADGMGCLRTAAAFLGQDTGLDRGRLDDDLATDREPTLSLLALRAEAAGLVSRNLRISLRDLAAPMVPFLFAGPDGRLKVAVALDRVLMTYGRPGQARRSHHRSSRRDAEGWWQSRALTIAPVPDFGGVRRGPGGNDHQVPPDAQTAPPSPRPALPAWPFSGPADRAAAAPRLEAHLIDHVLVFDDRDLLVLMLSAIVFASLMSMASNAASKFLMLRTANMINGLLMARFFSHVLSVPLTRVEQVAGRRPRRAFRGERECLRPCQPASSARRSSTCCPSSSSAPCSSPWPRRLAAFAVGISLLVCVIIVASSKRLRAYEVADLRRLAATCNPMSSRPLTA